MPKARKQLRLQKVMADCGIASRRKCEEIILEGRVKVNNLTITTLGTKVDPFYDAIEVDGELIDREAIDKIYIVMNKPRGYVTTNHDPEGRRTVLDLTPQIKQRIFPVGRLDYLSEGLLIMTNDGELANLIMHPRYEVTKVYEVKVFGYINEVILKKLKQGVHLNGEFLKPQSVRVIKQLPKKTWLEFKLTEGKNREIRRLCEAVDLTIDKLRRVAIENLAIDSIKPGDFEFISKAELLRSLKMDSQGKKLYNDKTYHSPKKSIRIKPSSHIRRKHDMKEADSEEFKRYRKDQYYTTLKMQKERELKAKLDAQAAAEAARS
jgi:23S rRNA pseudouridine2605 synthase